MAGLSRRCMCVALGPFNFNWSMAAKASLRCLAVSKVSAASIASRRMARVSLGSCSAALSMPSISNAQGMFGERPLRHVPIVNRSTLLTSFKNHGSTDMMRRIGSKLPLCPK